MFTQSVRWFCTRIAVLVGLSFVSGTVFAQATTTLPSGWQQMGPTEFASAIRELYFNSAFGGLSSADQQAAVAKAKTQFLAIDLTNTKLNYQTIEILQRLSRLDVDPDVMGKTKTALMARQDNWAGQPYAEVRAKFYMMNRLGYDNFDPSPRVLELRRWVAAGGAKSDIVPIDFKYDFVRQSLSDIKLIQGPFNVEWNGFVTAPQTGSYTFSVSPINVNLRDPDLFIKFNMSVSVGGQLVVDAKPGDGPNELGAINSSTWVNTGTPIGLTAGRPVAIKVNVSSDQWRVPTGTLHAVLFWQGPGVDQSVVPADKLTQTNGGDAGLKATYSWSANGQAQAVTRVEPNIDVAWTSTPIIIAADPTLPRQTATEMWNSMTSNEFIQSYLNMPGQAHPFLREPDNVSAGLTTAQRAAFLNLLQQNPTLLDVNNPWYARHLYESFRIGTPDLALDLFGLWAARQADIACEVSTGPRFDSATRAEMATMAMDVTFQLPNHAVRLQNEFLELADGRCCLPVAYILGASYLGRQKLNDWTAFLDNKLSESTLAGDTRVNWLIARAHAEEIRYVHPDLNINRDYHRAARATDGGTYLNQALRAASSPATKARVAREIASRMAWSEQYQAAQDLLQQTASSLPAAEQAALAKLKAQIAGMSTAQQQSSDVQVAAAMQSYIASLKQRRDQAAANGDTANAQRYDGLISAAGGQ